MAKHKTLQILQFYAIAGTHGAMVCMGSNHKNYFQKYLTNKCVWKIMHLTPNNQITSFIMVI